MYSVYQHWDPLKVCAVGASYPPEFYSYIANAKVRNVMERIAAETEEDYQKLITLLHSFGVETIRPYIGNSIDEYLLPSGKFAPPPMTPRDYTAMIGEVFYTRNAETSIVYNELKGSSWPENPKTIADWKNLPDVIKNELTNEFHIDIDHMVNHEILLNAWGPIYTNIKRAGNKINFNSHFNSAMTFRIGKDLYHGTPENFTEKNLEDFAHLSAEKFPDYRTHIVETGGHADSTYCPVVPGLIISLHDVPTYAETFPGWEVVYLPGQSWTAVQSFLDIKEKNKGKWWVPGEELNDEFTNFVEQWLGNWVGYVEETVFDVNMLVIDEKNVVCNNYNKAVFDAFNRHGITPHIVNFRHRYFWDGGLHCITADIHREGTQKDYFPERG